MLLIFVMFLITFVSARPLTCADNPIALWHFNEGIGNVTTDSCGGIIGDINGNYNWINGKYGKSIAFNGYNTFIDLTGKINQSFNDFSILAWIRDDGGLNTDYQTFVGREINFYGTYYWNFALAKDSVNQGYPESSYFNLFDNGNQNVIGTYFYSQYNTITNGNWHLLVGTFNSTDQSMTLYYDGNLVESSIITQTSIQSSTDYFLMGTAFNSDIWNYAYFLNGSLDDVAIFDRTLSQDEITDYYSDTPLNPVCNQTRQQLVPISYPYVDFNINYPMQYFAYLNDVPSYVGNVSIDIQELIGNISTFNFNWNYLINGYDLTLLFTEIGNYPFIIYSNSCPNTNNFTGTFIVRKSFNVTFCGYKQDDYSSYVNDYAYLIAEYSTSKKYYDTNLEQFITPLGFATTYKTPVFHTFYRDGCGTLKLYEEEEYVVRLFDGIATFPTTFSAPNITKTYGTNIYFGKYTLNSTNEDMKVLLSSKDIHQYRWLLNWLFIISIGLAFIISIFLFFVVPQIPSLSIIFGLGFVGMATLIRIVLWFWLGW